MIRVAGLLGVLLALATPALGAEDPWQVRRTVRAPTDPEGVVRALIAAPDDRRSAERLRGRLTPAELDRALAALRARAAGEGYAAVMAHAQLLLAAGRFAEALPELERASARSGGRLGPARARALALSRLGRPGQAGAVLEAAADHRGKEPLLRAELLAEAAELGEAGGDEAATDRRLQAGLELLSPAGAGARATMAGGSGRRLSLLRRLCATALRRGQGAACADRLAAHATRAPAAERRATWQAEAELREALGDYPGALGVWEAIVGGSGAGRDDAGDGPVGRMLVLLDRLGRRPQIEAAVARLARGGAGNQGALLAAVERAYQRGDRDLGGRLFDLARRGLGRSPGGLSRLADLASRFNDPARVLASWQAVLALDPRDEAAIVALGEAHFQGGRRELARETWRRLERVIRPAAEAHSRLAELLGDHDMLPEAIVEARKAQRLDRENPQHHRTLARILERKRDNSGAISEWRAVLAATQSRARSRAATGGPDPQAIRKEARLRLVGLLAREGRERLRAETVLLKDRGRRHPDDRETALFLAELQLRLAHPGEAVETLTATADVRPRDAEIVLFLVQLLRQSKQTIKALARLERFVEDAPERAAETWLRIAGLRAERYEDPAALAALARATEIGRGDADILVRSAELEESLAQGEAALAHYRAAAALGGPASAKAAAGAARLQALAGNAAAATRDRDAPVRGELVERLLPLWSYASSPGALLAGTEPGAQLRLERPLVEALATEVRGLYRRSGHDPQAAALLATRARALSRPFCDLLLEPGREAPLVTAAIEILGMLGNPDATASLRRVLESAELPAAAEQLRPVAAVALGRLRDERAAGSLVALARTPGPELRGSVIWALGRLSAPSAAEALMGAASDPRSEVAALALLGLGQQRRLATETVLRALRDRSAPVLVRRAAVVAAARAGLEGLGAPLTDLLAAPEPGLGACAAAALRVLGGPAARSPALWKLALLGNPPARAHAAWALQVLAPGVGGVTGDDARLLGAGPPAVPALLDDLCDPRPAVALPGALPDAVPTLPWREDAAGVGAVLAEALGDRGELAAVALRALEALIATGAAGAETAAAGPAGQALQVIAARVREPLAARLLDPDIGVRLGATRVAARLGQPELRAEQVAAALSATSASGRRAVAPQDPEATALLAAETARVRGHLHAKSLIALIRPLFDGGDWQSRRAVVRVLAAVNALPGDLEERARRDPHLLVREAVTVAGPPSGTQRD